MEQHRQALEEVKASGWRGPEGWYQVLLASLISPLLCWIIVSHAPSASWGVSPGLKWEGVGSDKPKVAVQCMQSYIWHAVTQLTCIEA